MLVKIPAASLYGRGVPPSSAMGAAISRPGFQGLLYSATAGSRHHGVPEHHQLRMSDSSSMSRMWGLVMTQFVWASLVNFGAVDAVLPAELSRTMFRQVGPLMAGLLIAGRVGSAIGAELAVLRLTEQIDAFESLAIDSFRHLVITRVAACVIALPILTDSRSVP